VITQPLDESYFQWLYHQVADADTETPSLTYWNLLRLLYGCEFMPQIPNDENRAEDGTDLRVEFLDGRRLRRSEREWMSLGCSMLELVVGLSRRLAFEAGGEPHYWFWRLLENIGVARYSDDRIIPEHRIEKILENVNNRSYKRNGLGGFFPLKHADRDQRKVELWYQLSAYVLELDKNG
jgi:hypothetical protein